MGRNRLGLVRGVGLALLAAGSLPAAAASVFQLGEVRLTVDGAASAGAAWRTRAPAPDIVPASNGAAAGVPGRATAGRNIDDGNLNFRRGDAVAAVAKTLLSVEASYGPLGLHLRGMAWRDFVLTDAARPWGNLPNGYTAGIPLGETSDHVLGRFSGAALLDANLHGTFQVQGRPLHLRAGNQRLPWGVPTLIPTGLNALNPVNLPALLRPGALPEEAGIPIPALFARFGLAPALDLEAFYQVAFRRSEPLGCGTFYSSADYLADRCDKVVLGGGAISDRDSLRLGAFAKRAADLPVSDGGQFGLGLAFNAEAIATRFGAYFAQYHNRGGMVGAIRAGRPVPIVNGDPDGLNARYFVQHPEDVRVFAVNAVTRLAALTLSAEVAHRPNQPVQLHGLDLSNAFLSATAPSLLRAEVDALPFGASYAAYDRLATTDFLVGARASLGGVLGARALVLGGEAGVKYVHDLPDVTVRRYGRADVIGTGQVGGVCPSATALACSNEGFVSRAAWGLRARAALTYAAPLPDTDLTPSVAYGYDAGGWSYDGAFSEGRQFAILSLRAEHAKRYAAEIAYRPAWGGR